MNKAKVEKKLTRIMKIARKIWLRYVDGLEEKGNEKIKETGYLTMTIFRGTSWFGSYCEDKDMRKENQVDTIMFTEGGKDEVENR